MPELADWKGSLLFFQNTVLKHKGKRVHWRGGEEEEEEEVEREGERTKHPHKLAKRKTVSWQFNEE